jgi:hypothetical protein
MDSTRTYSELAVGYLNTEVVEVMEGVGGGEADYGRVGTARLLLLLPLLQLLPRREILSHVLQPFDEPLLLPVGPEMRILKQGTI